MSRWARPDAGRSCPDAGAARRPDDGRPPTLRFNAGLAWSAGSSFAGPVCARETVPTPSALGHEARSAPRERAADGLDLDRSPVLDGGRPATRVAHRPLPTTVGPGRGTRAVRLPGSSTRGLTPGPIPSAPERAVPSAATRLAIRRLPRLPPRALAPAPATRFRRGGLGARAHGSSRAGRNARPVPAVPASLTRGREWAVVPPLSRLWTVAP
jgi:hypothetical protein